ncbi:hypothetical protein Taro_029307, partial [Colocasia esculenta]|nr:hypothetical protein [Colocasia esculenta]
MASCGRRGGAPARDDEQRREERAEQQAPAPQGPVLPPPPLVDYGVFMQGLVQAMQTQAHTQAALQAQLEAQQAQAPAQDHGGPSIMNGLRPVYIMQLTTHLITTYAEMVKRALALEAANDMVDKIKG